MGSPLTAFLCGATCSKANLIHLDPDLSHKQVTLDQREMAWPQEALSGKPSRSCSPCHVCLAPESLPSGRQDWASCGFTVYSSSKRKQEEGPGAHLCRHYCWAFLLRQESDLHWKASLCMGRVSAFHLVLGENQDFGACPSHRSHCADAGKCAYVRATCWRPEVPKPLSFPKPAMPLGLLDNEAAW
uniref:Uncharacterized protein n=1 Tax=Sphaerodactylus townsendi TaxID=933632 RepID=A0ACB8G0Z7_9SAUR